MYYSHFYNPRDNSNSFFLFVYAFPYSYVTTLYDNFSDKYMTVPQSWSVTRTSLGVFNICSIPGVTRPQKSITMVEASLWFSLSMGYWAAVDSQYMVHNYKYKATQNSHIQYLIHNYRYEATQINHLQSMVPNYRYKATQISHVYCEIFTSSIS